MKNILLWIIRIIVGGLFIFSGVVKANDPLGLSYKTQEFFEKMHLGFLHDYTLFLSIVMIILEIIAGVAILIGYKSKLYTWLLLGLILFFTYLTSFAMFVKGADGTPIIKECGCFGDCFKLSNWETFLKDVGLLVLILILFIFRKQIQPLFNKTISRIILYTVLLGTFWTQFHVLNHLPFVDCLPFKVGNNIEDKMKSSEDGVIESKFIYEKEGNQQKFALDALPDSTWHFVDRIDSVVKKPTKEQEIKDFILNDENGNDMVPSLMQEPNKIVLWFIKDYKEVSKDEVLNIKALYEDAVKNNAYMYCVGSFVLDDYKYFKKENKITEDIPFLMLDGTALKTAMRTNSGVMILDKGTIKAKFGKADIPKHL